MRKGLTGGIASGKGHFEIKFRDEGVPVFDSDQAGWMIRSGNIDPERNYEIIFNRELNDLCCDISRRVRANLRKSLPYLYAPDGSFSRAALLAYINHPQEGAKNLKEYEKFIRPASIELYQAWESQSNSEDTLLSCAILAESGNISLVDEIYILNTSREEQLRRLIFRSTKQKIPLSETEANQAIDRQWDFNRKYQEAVNTLGLKHVHVLEDRDL